MTGSSTSHVVQRCMTCLSIMWIRHGENLSAAYPKMLKFVSRTVKIIDTWIKLYTKKLRVINSLHKFYRSDDVQEDKIEPICRTQGVLEKYVQNLD
jgi:hypothetical protein